MTEIPQKTRAIPEAEPRKAPDKRAILSLALAVAISVGVFVITTHFRDVLSTLRGLGLLGVFVLSFLGNATVLVPAPAFVIACASGPLYGVVSSGVVAGIGSSLGEVTGYLAGYGGGAFIPHSKTYQKLRQLVERFGGWIIFALSLLPNPLFDVGGAIAGALKMPLWIFFLATAGGKVMRMLIIAWACANGMHWIGGALQQ